MKKLLLIAASAAMIFGSLTLTSCGGDADKTGGGSGYVGKAFTFDDVETEDDKPEEPSNETEEEPEYDSPDPQEEPETAPAKDSTVKESKEWIYFQTESKVVYGTVDYNVTYDGSTGEEKDREIIPDSIKKKYYGSYIENPTAIDNIPVLNLIYGNTGGNDDMGWSKLDKPYDVKRGFVTTGTEVSAKQYEFGVKKGDLKIKLTESKGNYNEWTTWTWENFEVKEEMKVNVETFDTELALCTFENFSNGSSGGTIEFNLDNTYKLNGTVVTDGKWSTMKKGDNMTVRIDDPAAAIGLSIKTYTYCTKKFGDFPRVKNEAVAFEGRGFDRFYDKEISFFYDNSEEYVKTTSNGNFDLEIKELVKSLYDINYTLTELLDEDRSQDFGDASYGDKQNPYDFY